MPEPARGTARPMLAMILTYGLGLTLAGVGPVIVARPVGAVREPPILTPMNAEYAIIF